ncbi:MAG: ABC transporter ATP-binding protein [Treponema sp.]|nr:ABC transporter ATP-binding protein [Treponema sp.]
MLDIKNLKAGYGKKNILDIKSLSFSDSGIETIAGCNGCGKSTLLKAILGIIPRNGDINFDGISIKKLSHKERAKKIAYLPQNCPSLEIDVMSLVENGRYPYKRFSNSLNKEDRELIEESINKVELWDKRYKNIKELSGGERQRAFLAMTIAQNTKILLLDEPTTYMDIAHQCKLMNILQTLSSQGKSIIMSSHDLPQSFTYSDNICLMKDGKILCHDKTDKIANQKEYLKEAFSLTLKEMDKNSNLLYRYAYQKPESL